MLLEDISGKDCIPRHRGRDHLTENLDLDLGAGPDLQRQVGVGEVFPHREPVAAAPQPAGHASTAVHCLTAINRHVLLAADRQRAQPPREVRLRSLEGLMPVEIAFVKPHAETKPGLERVVEQAHVVP